MEANSFLQMLKIAQQQEKLNPSSITTTHDLLAECDLDNVDCPICHNTGAILRKDEKGYLYSSECKCMAQRLSIRRIKRSGIMDMMERYTFDAYIAEDDERLKILHTARMYAENDYGWFYIAGQSGSGKTHICTAICSRLMERGKDVYYMRWRDESRQLKSIINDEEVNEPLERLKRIPVLYIDDFFKGSANEADVRLAFEIINARYNDSHLRTIFSSEINFEGLEEIDEAVCGRIYERSKGYRLAAPKENYRLR